jgi:ribonuclease J
VQHLIDDLFRLGARVIHKAFMDVHTSGHGFQEDMKKMFELTKPRNVMPVHGWPSFRDEMAYLLKKWGMDKSKILMVPTGQKYEFVPSKKIWIKSDKYPVNDIFVDGGRVGVINPQVLSQRQDLAEYGFVVGIIKVDKTHRMVGRPEIVYKGSIHGKVPAKVEQYLSDKFQSIRGKKHKLSQSDISRIGKQLEKSVQHLIRRETGKDPIVVISIV